MARAKRKGRIKGTSWMRAQGLAVLMLLAALVAVAVFLFDDRGEDPRYRIDLDRIVAESIPASQDAEAIFDSLITDLDDLRDSSLLDEEFTQELKNRLEANPWVREIHGVTRRFPGGLDLDLVFWEPWAELEIEGAYLLVQEEGEILPVVLDEPRGLEYRMVLRPDGDPDAPVGPITDAWLRSAVREGAQVYHDIENQAGHDGHEVLTEIGIRAIEISNHQGRLDQRAAEISIITARDRIEAGTGRSLPVVLRWGRSTKHRYARIELSPKRKLNNLLDLIRSRPGALEGLGEVVVNFDDPLGVKPN